MTKTAESLIDTARLQQGQPQTVTGPAVRAVGGWGKAGWGGVEGAGTAEC